VQQFLPLAHHAHVLVVEDEDLDRQARTAPRSDSSWMFIWIEASPAMSMTSAVRMRDLHADRRRQAVAHRAQARPKSSSGSAPRNP
jgi:hypothetical protein